MKAKQLTLFDERSANCPFVDLLEPDDHHCFAPQSKGGYEVLSECHADLQTWLARIRGVGLGDVKAKPIPRVGLPNFIPTVTVGSKSLLAGNSYEFIAVSLRDIVSPKKLLMPEDIRKRFGIPQDTRIILLNYAEDSLIEKIWPDRKNIFKKIARLGFDLATSVNYSIWFNQPHAERLINLKRSLITFEELQVEGVPTIPHVYWYGRKDLERWACWLKQNPDVWCVAINLQTERDYRNDLWTQTLEDLGYFISILEKSPHFIITGASKPERIYDLKNVLPSFTLTNGSCARKAACGFILKEDKGKLRYSYSNKIPKSEILNMNTKLYLALMNSANKFQLS